MSTSSLTIPMTDGPGDLVFSGVKDANPLGLISMNRPGQVARTVYADNPGFLDGDLPTSATWNLANINAVVHLDGTSQADLEAKYDRIVTVLAQRRFQVVQEWNGVERTWSAHRGSITPVDASSTPWDLAAFQALYSLTIPVQPNPVGA